MAGYRQMLKKRHNFSYCEIEPTVEESRKKEKQILLGSLSSGISNTKKKEECQRASDAVNQQYTLKEIQKSGLILKGQKTTLDFL